MDGKSLVNQKPKRVKARIQRILKKLEPQLVESNKRCIIMKGHHSSAVVNDVLLNFGKLLKPNCVNFNRKNEILPFEDSNSLEFLSQKNNCSLFVIGSHTKKRKQNIVMGRTFDGHILDMIEFGVDNFQSMSEFEGMKKTVGSKPMMIFQGSQWESDSLYTRIQNLFMDFFRGVKYEKLSLSSLDHILLFSVVDGRIFIRAYAVTFKKSGTKIPNAHLIPMGPYMDLTLRRHQIASDDMWKTSCKQPKGITPNKVKNISRTSLGDKVGRIHMKKQNLDKMGGRRVTALRDSKRSLDVINDTGDGNSKPKRTRN